MCSSLFTAVEGESVCENILRNPYMREGNKENVPGMSKMILQNNQYTVIRKYTRRQENTSACKHIKKTKILMNPFNKVPDLYPQNYKKLHIVYVY